MSIPADRSLTTVAVAGRTDTGRTRSENQDTFLATELLDPKGTGSASRSTPVVLGPAEGQMDVERRFLLGSGGALFLVADGMGGAAGGATASRTAVKCVADEIQSRWTAEGVPEAPERMATFLRDAIQSANQEIQERAKTEPTLQGMGTTFTAALMVGGTLVLAQVGDSRAYLLRNGEMRQLTRDQSVVQEMIDAGAMTVEEARRSPQRNMILQAIGTSSQLKVVCSDEEPQAGDFLLLCSDGLCGVVTDAAMAQTIGRESDLARACSSLVDQANDAGGPDNITVVLVGIGTDGVAGDEDGGNARSDTRPFRRIPSAP